jgi:hypothetical protein
VHRTILHQCVGEANIKEIREILLMVLPVKGTVTKFFASDFFHGSPSPKPLKTTESFQIFFENSRRYSQVKVHHWYQRHRWRTLSCEYLREFSKKFETALMVYSGAWGKLIHEKNQKSNISWHCPFNFHCLTKFHLLKRRSFKLYQPFLSF